MPFDQFTIEQLAGDLLPEATDQQKLATAFLRNHMINGEGGRLAEENRIDYLVDQTDAVSTIWMGVTMACARILRFVGSPSMRSESPKKSS